MPLASAAWEEASPRLTAAGGEAEGDQALCGPASSFRLPQRPAPHPAAPLTTPSFPNPRFTDDRESPCRAQPLSAARHAEVISPSRKCQVSQREYHHSQTLGPSGLCMRRGSSRIWGTVFLGHIPSTLRRPPSGPGPPPSQPSSQGPSPSRASEVGSPWFWTQRTPTCISGSLGLSFLICKTGINQGLPPTAVGRTHTSSLDHSQGFRKRNLLSVALPAGWFGQFP